MKLLSWSMKPDFNSSDVWLHFLGCMVVVFMAHTVFKTFLSWNQAISWAVYVGLGVGLAIELWQRFIQKEKSPISVKDLISDTLACLDAGIILALPDTRAFDLWAVLFGVGSLVWLFGLGLDRGKGL